MPPTEEHSEILRLLKENTLLLEQNNVLLRKIHRFNVIETVIRCVWLAALIGLPFALYYYVLGPYFEIFGANYETFRLGMAEIPGLKGLEHLLPAFRR